MSTLPPRNLDSYLPNEILSHVFTYLLDPEYRIHPLGFPELWDLSSSAASSFAELVRLRAYMRQLFTCLLVCRAWAGVAQRLIYSHLSIVTDKDTLHLLDKLSADFFVPPSITDLPPPLHPALALPSCLLLIRSVRISVSNINIATTRDLILNLGCNLTSLVLVGRIFDDSPHFDAIDDSAHESTSLDYLLTYPKPLSVFAPLFSCNFSRLRTLVLPTLPAHMLSGLASLLATASSKAAAGAAWEFPVLQTLDLSSLVTCSDQIGDFVVTTFVQACPKVHSVSLPKVSTAALKRIVEKVGHQFSHFRCPTLNLVDDDEAREILGHLPNLRTFFIGNMSTSTLAVLAELCPGLSGLSVARVSADPTLNHTSEHHQQRWLTARVVALLQSLKHLRIGFWSGLSIETFKAIFRYCSNLLTLDIWDRDRISESSVQELFVCITNACPKLVQFRASSTCWDSSLCPIVYLAARLEHLLVIGEGLLTLNKRGYCKQTNVLCELLERQNCTDMRSQRLENIAPPRGTSSTFRPIASSRIDIGVPGEPKTSWAAPIRRACRGDTILAQAVGEGDYLAFRNRFMQIGSEASVAM
ncbi:uncharacterized protein BJ171DRAFT_600145 [Polychytrium aggregatum]|uniref:uncharacterized protein n=1 Tax=Polychytrium aggregatum TaxID=110093 RepID=UPI0022FDE6BC|nr:uncharacterized protein BJ171DRAFT_600145 [Polychytrium aggregatum]KAI9203279.1 hypothetical protein BJ171DRAFT_600145 [Polychytrium aggregatum]